MLSGTGVYTFPLAYPCVWAKYFHRGLVYDC